MTSATKTFQRLPTAVKPIKYKLHLHPSFETFKFAGTSLIEVDVVKTTQQIVVNAADLSITKAVFSSGSKELIGKVTLDQETETATFDFSEDLPLGAGSLSLVFDGTVNDKLKGFYRSKCKYPNGDEHYAFITQFEPTDARRAFPCWDEPAVKAIFSVSMTVPKKLVALSNMPEKSSKDCEDGVSRLVEFADSPIMSTYLVAFFIGDFEHIGTKDKNGVDIRIFFQRGKKVEVTGRFALDVSARCLPFYNDYFNIAYPLPKMDVVAVPDFAAGAMENWGLNTYREINLMVDPDNTSIDRKQYVAMVVCHELAHQWFGNLVTMEWWTHLWLNEGFAAFMQFLSVDRFYPEWNMWSQFLAKSFSSAANLDSLESSHPVEVPVSHPSEINEIFDAISYNKGSSLIRMVYNFIGDDAFRKGMHIYLERFKYANASTEDLWAALEEASGKKIAYFMKIFTGQMGYPILFVDRDVKDNQSFNLRQQKFRLTGSNDGKLWAIPVTAVREKDPAKRIVETVFDTEKGQVEASKSGEPISQDEWIKFNEGTIGFFRVHYSAPLLANLARGIKTGTLSSTDDRFGMVSDMSALCRAGIDVSISQLLDFLINYAESENSLPVWEEIGGVHTALGGLVQHTEHAAKFGDYTRRLFGPIAKKLGWESKPDEAANVAPLRAMALSRFGKGGDEATVAEAKRRFDDHVSKKAAIPADFRETVYGIVAKHGDADSYSKMMALYKEADLIEEQVRLLRGLAQHGGIEQKRASLQWAVHSGEVKPGDLFHFFGAVVTCKESRVLTWQFVKDNWKVLSDRYEGSFFMFGRILAASTETFYDETMAADLEKFFAANPFPAAKRVAEQSAEKIRVQAAWLKREKPSLDAFFAKF